MHVRIAPGSCKKKNILTNMKNVHNDMRKSMQKLQETTGARNRNHTVNVNQLRYKHVADVPGEMKTRGFQRFNNCKSFSAPQRGNTQEHISGAGVLGGGRGRTVVQLLPGVGTLNFGECESGEHVAGSAMRNASLAQTKNAESF